MEYQSDQDRRGVSIRRISRDRTSCVFSPTLAPVLIAGRGETIILETQDCYGGRLTEDPKTYPWADSEERNPVTGPVYIEGAEAGDVLCVHIQRIRVASSGIVMIRPKAGILGTEVRQTLVRQVSIRGERVTLADGLSLPLRPVVGAIGVASRHGEISTLYPGRHGGNMDTLEITAGVRVYLPVQVKGALLSLGNVKACMGDGETSGTGVEAAAEITVRLDTLPGGRFPWPRLESQDACTTIASASSVEQAVRLAVMEMVRWLEQDKGLDFETAYMIVGLGGDLRISQMVNPLVTARVALPKSVMNTIQRRTPLGSRTVLVSAPAGASAEPKQSAPPSPPPEPPPEKPVPAPAEQKETPETVPTEAEPPPETQTAETAEARTDAPRRRRRWRRRKKSAPAPKDREDRQRREQAGDAGTGTPREKSVPDKKIPAAGTPDVSTSQEQKKTPETGKEKSAAPEKKTPGSKSSFRRRRPVRRRNSRSSSQKSGPAKHEGNTDAPEKDSSPQEGDSER